MAKVEGVPELKAKLKKAAEKGGNVEGTTGYTQAYGIYVHENLEAKHPIGNAKFLENPLRDGKAQMQAIIVSAMKSGKTMKEAVTLALLWLQRESQLQCPVDTAALRNSAFTRVEEVK